VDIDHVIGTYTGQAVTWDDLLDPGRRGGPILRGLGRAVERAADAVADADTELARLAGTIAESTAKVRESIEARPGQPVRIVNPRGELQATAPRFDALIGLRSERIAHLRTLTGLWQQATAAAAAGGSGPASATSTDLAAALTGLGLHPIDPAHAATAAAYGHQHGDLYLDVSVNPFGDAGVEINASHRAGEAATMVWTATFSADTPTAVVVVAARAALRDMRHAPGPGRSAPRPDVARWAAHIMAAIDDDIAAGGLPASVASLTDLHDYVDANDYLQDAGVPMPTAEGGPDAIAAVQDEVSRRLSAPDRPHCTYAACAYPKHDHTTTQGPDGADLDEPVAMRCGHCALPAHYDEKLGRYRHDDPAAPDCFLISRNPR